MLKIVRFTAAFAPMSGKGQHSPHLANFRWHFLPESGARERNVGGREGRSGVTHTSRALTELAELPKDDMMGLEGRSG